MTLQIIIRSSRTNPIGKLKGRSVSEFAKNMESEGWPSEFKNEGERDRVAFEEKKLGRAITRKELKKIK